MVKMKKDFDKLMNTFISDFFEATFEEYHEIYDYCISSFYQAQGLKDIKSFLKAKNVFIEATKDNPEIYDKFIYKIYELENCLNEELGFEILAVPVKNNPVIKGEAAKKILKQLESPTDKSEFFKKCAETAKIFTIK